MTAFVSTELAWKRGKVTAYFPYDAHYTDTELAELKDTYRVHVETCSACDVDIFKCGSGSKLLMEIVWEDLRRDGK